MFHEILFPTLSVIVPICVLCITRLRDKGEKHKSKMEIDLAMVTQFADTNRIVIQKLVKDAEQLEERTRKTENDISRLWGKLNGKPNS